ncbi:MAG TPA: nuclear transport factor 2 family protein [Solirubrobacteraceae bacterium]|nr:nuclear transport factor 2 family protein [Solirubrobacteraceae bacterium]
MRTVTAAFAAISEAGLDELAALLAKDFDWHGVRDQDGLVPHCRGRATALERMRIGVVARGKVAVSALVEEGDCVLAHVHRVDDEDGDAPRERFVVAEVHGGQITRLDGVATEPEAREALRAAPADDG